MSAKNMLGIFKEYVWEYRFGLGKVFSILGALLTVWSLVLLFNPDVYNRVPQTIAIDARWWYGLTIALLLATIVLVLNGASEYRKRVESNNNLHIVYSERYPACREDKGNSEIVRVGLRVAGQHSVDSPIVMLTDIWREGVSNKDTRIPVISTPLSAMVTWDSVHSGRTTEYWVNVFKHKYGTNEIELCYDRRPTKTIPLSDGSYSIGLTARANPNNVGYGTLIITMVDNKLHVDIGGKSIWNT